MTVKLNNYSKPMGKRGEADYFRWRVFVDEPEGRLMEIDKVQYSLHPTFPEPNRVSSDLRSRFGLETSGWGEFTILAIVRFKDGHEEKVQYRLDLSKPWPSEEVTAH